MRTTAPNNAQAADVRPAYLRLPAAAKFLSVSVPYLRAAIYKKEGPKHIKVGRLMFFEPEDLKSWLASRGEVVEQC